MWVVQLSWGCQTGEASGGASWEPGCQAMSVVGHVTVPSSMSSLADIWLSLWEASNQNCPPEPFPSSQPTKLQAKLNDYFKPLSLGVICDASIVKGIVCEWKPEITKSQTLFFPCIIISLLFHTLRICGSQPWWDPLQRAGNGMLVCGCFHFQSLVWFSPQIFKSGLSKWVEKRQIALSYGLKTSKVAFLLTNSLFCKSVCNSTIRNDELFGIICLVSLPRKRQQKENQES